MRHRHALTVDGIELRADAALRARGSGVRLIHVPDPRA